MGSDTGHRMDTEWTQLLSFGVKDVIPKKRYLAGRDLTQVRCELCDVLPKQDMESNAALPLLLRVRVFVLSTPNRLELRRWDARVAQLGAVHLRNLLA